MGGLGSNTETETETETTQKPETTETETETPNPADPTQYRPISLTSICCKIFERSVKTFLNEFITKHNIISEHQHGFQSKKSTQTQLLECSNNWTYWVDKREGVDVVYLDISKAFDSVSHSKLLHKLQKYGIRGKFFNCIKSFLEGRAQRVKVNNSFSKASHVKSGVPQGSVLGPLLFLLYINDVVGSLKNCSIKIFADDCKVYFCIKKYSGPPQQFVNPIFIRTSIRPNATIAIKSNSHASVSVNEVLLSSVSLQINNGYADKQPCIHVKVYNATLHKVLKRPIHRWR